jgi:hypothetical protein
MCKVLNEDLAHNLYSVLSMGGVWVMLYTTVLYSLLWMQSRIPNESSDVFDNYGTVEDRYI